MTKTLEQIAEQLSTPTTVKKTVPTKTKEVEEVEEVKPVPKVQLIYAFNGTGKTRLCTELKDFIAPKDENADSEKQSGFSQNKFLYYSALTEDLFYWDKNSSEPKLNIQPNLFTNLIVKDQGLDKDISNSFQKFTGSKAEALFDPSGSSVSFIYMHQTALEEVPATKGEPDVPAKISKGEESNFVWSVFRTLLEAIISDIDENDPSNRSIPNVDKLEYVFIDDPVSSLDDSHLIELAVDLANIIKKSRYEENQGLRFVITTHNPLFYNVLHNELNNDLTGKKSDGSTGKVYKKKHSAKYVLKKHADGTFQLEDSNDRPFSYHLFLLSKLRKIESSAGVEKYHFNFLRNILEKTATFLGYKQWDKLLDRLPGDNRDLMSRMLNLYSHSAHAGEEIADLKDEDKEKFIKLIKNFTQAYSFAEVKENKIK